MISTEEDLAVDAQRLGEVAQELFGIACRLQARYPASHTLVETVDRFIDAALEGELRRAA
jgi:hypothetical protein